jgi:nucleoside-diphosphate-sugar epimerase
MLTHRNPDPRLPTRIVILGRDGFVPSVLRRDAEKRGLPLLVLGSAALDLTDPSSVGKLTGELKAGDALVMTAALTPEKGRDIPTLVRNLRMAEHVAAAVAARPCAQLVYFSSDSVYGWDTSDLSEETPPSPDNLYGVMHLAREIALREATAKAGVAFCVLRPCAIYGARDTHNAYGPNRFVRSALSSGRIEVFGDGDDIRDHIHVDDVVRVTWLAVEHGSSGILNLAGGQPVTFAHVAAEIVRLAGRLVTVVPVKRAGKATRRTFSTQATASAFPSYSPVPLSSGLAQMISELRGS